MRKLILLSIIGVFMMGVMAFGSYDTDRELTSILGKIITETQKHIASLHRAKNPEEIVTAINEYTKRTKPLMLKMVEVKKKNPYHEPSRHLELMAMAFEQECVKMGKTIGYIKIKYPYSYKIREAVNRMRKELKIE